MTKTAEVSYIFSETGAFSSYSLNEEAIRSIDSQEEMEKATGQIMKILDSGEVINLGFGVLMMKIKDRYVVSPDHYRREKIANRQNIPYEKIRNEDGLFGPTGDYIFQDKIGVTDDLESAEYVSMYLRVHYGPGLKTQVVDTWTGEILGEKPGCRI